MLHAIFGMMVVQGVQEVVQFFSVIQIICQGGRCDYFFYLGLHQLTSTDAPWFQIFFKKPVITFS
jgi:hypothetical protein